MLFLRTNFVEDVLLCEVVVVNSETSLREMDIVT